MKYRTIISYLSMNYYTNEVTKSLIIEGENEEQELNFSHIFNFSCIFKF